MPITWTRSTVTRNNPFDGTSDTVIEVTDVAVSAVPCRERYVFPDGTSDADIEAKILADLGSKGYNTT